MSNINKQALREAAEKATHGEWCSDDRHGVIADAGLNGNYYIASCSGPGHRDNKRFIAAANPSTVLALLDELEAAEKRIADHDRKCDEQYLLGMLAGWNFGLVEDSDGYDAAFNSRRKLIEAAVIKGE
ncbi:MAG: ead/Ea22-like family protein [Leclercia sp.]